MDVTIIGSGPSGLTASIYLARQNKKVQIVYKDKGILAKVKEIDNFFGFSKSVSGLELLDETIKKAKELGVEFIEDEIVGFDYQDTLVVKGLKGNYASKYVIIATGVNRAKPNIKGLDTYLYKGVSYCATCDGYQYKNKDVAVIGNSNYGLHEALELANVANKVYLLSNNLKVDIEIPENIIHIPTKINEIKGQEFIEAVSFIDDTEIKVSGVFVALNTSGATTLAKTIGASTNDKFILTNEHKETDIPNLYAIGDATSEPFQIVKASNDGMLAAYAILEKEKA